MKACTVEMQAFVKHLLVFHKPPPGDFREALELTAQHGHGAVATEAFGLLDGMQGKRAGSRGPAEVVIVAEPTATTPGHGYLTGTRGRYYWIDYGDQLPITAQLGPRLHGAALDEDHPEVERHQCTILGVAAAN